MTTPARRARGFTLMELMVGTSVALTVLAAAGATLVHLDRFRLLSITRAELERDMTLATGWLRRDVYAAGAGMRPGGLRGSPGVAGSALSPPFRNVSATGFEMYAELPRPDTNFDGLSNLGDRSTAAAGWLFNELSGRCPDQAACLAGPGVLLGSLFANAGVACTDASSPNTTLTCPWGMRKLVTSAGSNGATVVFADGHYENTTLTGFSAVAAGPYKVTFGTGLSGPPSAPLAAGVLLQVDKIGYRVTSVGGRTVLQRRHCWGAPQPEVGTFANCVAGSNDTDWQTIARDVAGTEFRFYGADGVTTTTTDANVRAAEVHLVLSRQPDLSGGGLSAPRKVTLDLTERLAPGTPIR